MSKIFIKTGSIYRVGNNTAIETMPVLPPKIFNVSCSMEGFFLSELSGFDLPPKIYGSAEKHADRMIAGFLNTDKSLGVHLDGEKGSGKTMLAKLIAYKMAADRNCPTLVVNSPFTGDGFNKFMQDIEQESVVIFDEFEKIFDAEDQNRILTLLDGVYPMRKLFIITTNDDYKVSNYMKDRPSRVWYKMQFKNLEYDFVKDYLDDVLINKDHAAGVLKLCRMANRMNFDMLQAVVKEMNDFNEPVTDVLKYLNVKPNQDDAIYNVSMVNIKTGEKMASLYSSSNVSPDQDYDYEMYFEGLSFAQSPEFYELMNDALKREKEKQKAEESDDNPVAPISQLNVKNKLIRKTVEQFLGLEEDKIKNVLESITKSDELNDHLNFTKIFLTGEDIELYDEESDSFVFNPKQVNEALGCDMRVVMTRQPKTVERSYYDFL